MSTLSCLVVAWLAVTTEVDAQTALKFEPQTAQSNASRVVAARARTYGSLRTLFAEHGLDYPPKQVFLRHFKREALLELWVRPAASRERSFVLLKSYKVCAGSGTLGPKRRRGDMQVPEGFYEITSFNPTSSFHLSMKVGYPNRSDRLRATRGDAGGDIYMHGSCVTIGCIPLTDELIEELYLVSFDTHSKQHTPVVVHIFPTHLRGESLRLLEAEYSERTELLRFWQELEPGYRIFEDTHVLPVVRVGADGAYETENSK